MHPRNQKRIKGAAVIKRGLSRETVDFIKWHTLGIRPSNKRIEGLTGVNPSIDPEAYEEYLEFLNFISTGEGTVTKIISL